MHPELVRTDMGGAGADLTVQESVAYMLGVIHGLTPERSGSSPNYDAGAIALVVMRDCGESKPDGDNEGITCKFYPQKVCKIPAM